MLQVEDNNPAYYESSANSESDIQVTDRNPQYVDSRTFHNLWLTFEYWLGLIRRKYMNKLRLKVTLPFGTRTTHFPSSIYSSFDVSTFVHSGNMKLHWSHLNSELSAVQRIKYQMPVGMNDSWSIYSFLCGWHSVALSVQINLRFAIHVEL